ncbi:MAG: YciI family protein, partial [Actinophytocola sp.]|uniref:YciI family protein n=1 Tax=Actinophytocola sp. TaxID=1872138 RepID=UPI003C738D7B
MGSDARERGPDRADAEEVQESCDFYEALGKELTATGEFVTTEGLADPSHTKTLRKAADGVVTTDGPYAEAKEVLVSYTILDCASHERAMEIATRVDDAADDRTRESTIQNPRVHGSEPASRGFRTRESTVQNPRVGGSGPASPRFRTRESGVQDLRVGRSRSLSPRFDPHAGSGDPRVFGSEPQTRRSRTEDSR